MTLKATANTLNKTQEPASPNTKPIPTPESVFIPNKEQLLTQRFTYQAAKNAIKNKHIKTAKAFIKRLDDYPLIPYLEYRMLTSDITQASFDDIDHFLRAHSGSLLADQLLRRFLFVLAKQKKWSAFNHYYSHDHKATDMRCRSLLARFHTAGPGVLDEALEMWTVGRSQPDACDPIFAQLKKHGKLTDSVRWNRFDLAMRNKRYSLARYIQKEMSKPFRDLADLYFAVHKQPKRVVKKQDFARSNVPINAIVSYGIARLARKDPVLAWKTWEKYEAERLFMPQVATDTKRVIVKQLTRKGHLKEAEQMLSYSHSLRQQGIVEALLREQLEQQNWSKVIDNIALLDVSSRESDRWQYWLARAHDALQSPKQNTQSLYEKLASQRSWYGFLAADILGKDYQLVDASQPANPLIKTDVKRMAVMQRAQELWAIGEYRQARAEWDYGLTQLDSDELIAAGELAKDWGWYNSGITAMIKGNLWDHLNLRFPLAYQDSIQQAAANQQLDQALIFAIARQESAFASDAVSHAGARGLMQLMPATAKEQARKSGVKHRTKDLLKPDHNIALGSAYLQKLIKDFNGNRVLATAAYNAGPHRVKRWLQPLENSYPIDIWVETIPFKETRRYVQNVLTYSVIYGYRTGSINQLLQEAEAKITL